MIYFPFKSWFWNLATRDHSEKQKIGVLCGVWIELCINILQREIEQYIYKSSVTLQFSGLSGKFPFFKISVGLSPKVVAKCDHVVTIWSRAAEHYCWCYYIDSLHRLIPVILCDSEDMTGKERRDQLSGHCVLWCSSPLSGSERWVLQKFTASHCCSVVALCTKDPAGRDGGHFDNMRFKSLHWWFESSALRGQPREHHR